MNQSLSSRRQFVTHSAGFAAAMALPHIATAETWPNKPVRIVVPYPPGGFTDVTARLIAQKLQDRLGQPFVIDNKGGANGSVGTSMVARSAPDGTTFGVVIAAYAANTSLYSKLPYDPQKDLIPVSLIGISPLLAAVGLQAPFKTASELIAFARKSPGRISFGSSGSGSAAHLTTELLKAQTQTRMVHIPYRGAAAALTDLMAGQIDLLFDAASGLISPGKAGKVVLIGVASERRLPVLPEVPTFIEQGIKSFTGNTWIGMLAPAGTSTDVTKRLADEIAVIVRSDEVRSRLDAMGTIPVGSAPDEFGKFIALETQKWGQVIRGAKVVPD